jgi:hypothetical protein
MPTTWPGLYDEVDRLDLSKRRFDAARAEFESWAARTEERALAEAYTSARVRARELYERTAVAVTAEEIRTRPGSSFGSRLSLGLGASRVDLYAVRNPGSSPCLHLGVQRAATSTRAPVFTTLPGALLVRRFDDGFDALCLPVPADTGDCPTITMDGLVLRAFELLIGTHRSTRP